MIPRHSPIKRRKPLKSGGRPKKVNRKRKERLFRENFGGEEFLALIHSLPCGICGVEGLTVAAHLKSRGAGGKAQDVAPLCCTQVVTEWTREIFHGVPVVYDRIREGCHERYDSHDPEIRKHESRLRLEAKERWTNWQASLTER